MTITANPGPLAQAHRDIDVLAHVQPQLHVGGQWIDASNAATFDVRDPSTGEVLRTIADASSADGLSALDAASSTQASWSRRPARERGEILRRAYDLLTQRGDDLALLITLESGKPLREAYAEVAYGAEFFRWYAEEAVRIRGQMGESPDGNGKIWTLHQTVGPCLLITPWNFPLAMATRKIGPAIAAGCTMIVKPAEQTPLTTTQAGPVVEPMIRDGRIRKVSFTGSAAVGRRLITLGAEHIVRMSMELGGSAPLIDFDDTDLDAAVDGAISAKMRNAGQACIAANRIYVQRAVAEEFTERFTARLAGLTVGRGTDEGVDVGLLIDDQAVVKVSNLVDDAVAKGARCLLGGAALPGAGHFFAPTLLVNVPASARINSEEIFGPIAPLTFFDTEEEALRLANATEYGLTGYVFTADIQRAFRVADRLETGMVGSQQDHHLQSCRPVRRDEALRIRPRRGQCLHSRVPRNEVRRQPRLVSWADRGNSPALVSWRGDRPRRFRIARHCTVTVARRSRVSALRPGQSVGVGTARCSSSSSCRNSSSPSTPSGVFSVVARTRSARARRPSSVKTSSRERRSAGSTDRSTNPRAAS